MNKAVCFTVAFLIKFLIFIPFQLLGLLVVPIAILTNWPSIFWPWNNQDHPVDGGNFWKNKCGDTFWCKYQWFALRNPCFNLGRLFSVSGRPYKHVGDLEVGDKSSGGSYWVFSSPFFEYYLIKPYGKRCLRIRFGWKLYKKPLGKPADFCFVVNPFQPYLGK